VFECDVNARSVIGRIVAKGMANELYDGCYLVFDGIDSKAHYVSLIATVKLEQYPLGAMVEVQNSTEFWSADKNTAALAVNGLYRPDHHLTLAKA
jgi:hypothetical protein